MRRVLDLTKRFSFGINLDDPWRYSGETPPKSIIVPHLLSVGLPESRVLEQADEREILVHADVQPRTAAARAAVALADNLVEAEVDFVRCWFPWKYFEPVPVPESSLNRLFDQSYQKWPMDNLVDTLTNRSIAVVPVVACGYQRMLPDGLEPDKNRQMFIKRAAIHARLLARHYKDRIRSWQIENEPNWWAEHAAGGWRSGVTWVEDQDFKHELLKDLNDALHAEDPNASTIINLEADARTLAPGQFSSYCDILGLDFYPNYRSAHPINPGVSKLANQVGTTLEKPVLVSETGYPSGPGILGYSNENQAEYVEGACREAYSLDHVTGIGIWRYIDTAWKSFPPQENHFGLLDNAGTPKPAWLAYSKVIKELKSASN